MTFEMKNILLMKERWTKSSMVTKWMRSNNSFEKVFLLNTMDQSFRVCNLYTTTLLYKVGNNNIGTPKMRNTSLYIMKTSHLQRVQIRNEAKTYAKN